MSFDNSWKPLRSLPVGSQQTPPTPLHTHTLTPPPNTTCLPPCQLVNPSTFQLPLINRRAPTSCPSGPPLPPLPPFPSFARRYLHGGGSAALWPPSCPGPAGTRTEGNNLGEEMETRRRRSGTAEDVDVSGAAPAAETMCDERLLTTRR